METYPHWTLVALATVIWSVLWLISTVVNYYVSL